MNGRIISRRCLTDYQLFSTDIERIDASLDATPNSDKEVSAHDSINPRDGMTEPAWDESRDFAFAHPEEVALPFHDVQNDAEAVDLVLGIQ